MRPFPPISELAFLIGAKVESVAFGPYNVTLFFQGHSQITSEHIIEIVSPDERLDRYDVTAQLGDPGIFDHITGKGIVKLDTEDLALSLTFEDGTKIRIYTAIGPYESGQISHQAPGDGSDLFFVF